MEIKKEKRKRGEVSFPKLNLTLLLLHWEEKNTFGGKIRLLLPCTSIRFFPSDNSLLSHNNGTKRHRIDLRVTQPQPTTLHQRNPQHRRRHAPRSLRFLPPVRTIRKWRFFSFLFCGITFISTCSILNFRSLILLNFSSFCREAATLVKAEATGRSHQLKKVKFFSLFHLRVWFQT